METAPIDLVGFVYSALAASGIVFGLSVISLPALPPQAGIGATLIGLIACLLYVRHARRHAAPLLDLTIFRNSTFRVSAISGAIFRIAGGAIPFLMPLMLQIGFGMTPFESGLITFVGAIGALTTKFLATRVLAAFGFRYTMMLAVVAGSVTTAANAIFTPETPHLIIMGSLLVAGFCRSFFHQCQRACLCRYR